MKVELLTADQIDSLTSYSIIEVRDGFTCHIYQKIGDSYWRGTTGTNIYRGSGFPIGKTYLVREGSW